MLSTHKNVFVPNAFENKNKIGVHCKIYYIAYVVLSTSQLFCTLMCKLHGDCVWFVSYTCFSHRNKPLGYTPTVFNNTV